MTADDRLLILLFAGVRDAARRDSIGVQIDLPATAAQVIERLVVEIPAAAELIRVSRLAVGGDYVHNDYSIERSDQEFALIPPVSGG